MKELNKIYMQGIIGFATLLMLVSCVPNVLFQEAVPPGVDAINEVPENFQGVFVCESDSSRIYADRFVVYNESYHMFVTAIDRVNETENCSIVAGGLYLPGRKECIPFEYIGEDSIQAKVYSIDTLFSFKDTEVMKLYKGRLFMNYQNDQNEWITYMISPMEDGAMNWEIIDVPDKVHTVEEITHDYKTRKNEDDETMYIIKPTLVEFDRILQKGYSSQCDILTPINFELINMDLFN